MVKVLDTAGEGNQNGIRSLLNTNNRENSEKPIGAAKAIHSEIPTQATSKLDEIRSDLISQILEATNTAIAEKLLLIYQNTFNKQEKGTSTVVESCGLHRDPCTKNARETLEICPRNGFNLTNWIHSSSVYF